MLIDLRTEIGLPVPGRAIFIMDWLVVLRALEGGSVTVDSSVHG